MEQYRVPDGDPREGQERGNIILLWKGFQRPGEIPSPQKTLLVFNLYDPKKRKKRRRREDAVNGNTIAINPGPVFQQLCNGHLLTVQRLQ